MFTRVIDQPVHIAAERFLHGCWLEIDLAYFLHEFVGGLISTL